MKKSRFGTRDKLILFLVIVGAVFLALFIAHSIYMSGTRRGIAGIREPLQETVKGGGMHRNADGFETDITFKCYYDIEALVLSTHDYNGSELSDKFAPVDAALGWGKVAQYNDIIDFNWEQSGRFCRCDPLSAADVKLLGSVEYVQEHFSNNHLIPAEKDVEKKIKKIRKGDHIRIRGYLVNVDGSSEDASFHWHSSTSRSDTGNGACEIIYVTNVDWIE